MKFLVGEKVKNTMRDKVGVVMSVSVTTALVDYGKNVQGELTSLKYLELVKQQPSPHRVETANGRVLLPSEEEPDMERDRR